MLDLLLRPVRVPMDQHPHAARQAARHRDLLGIEQGHVLPALMRRFHEAKQDGVSAVTVWGTGKPRREFLHVDDLADCAWFLMMNYSEPEIVKSAPHAQAIRQIKGDVFEDPEKWAMTWRAYLRKHGQATKPT